MWHQATRQNQYEPLRPTTEVESRQKFNPENDRDEDGDGDIDIRKPGPQGRAP